MFRLLPKIAVGAGLAAALILVALAPGSSGRVAQAAPSVTVAAPGAASCGVPVTVSAIVTDPVGFVAGLPVTFSSAQGTFLTPSTSTGVTGVASTSFTPSGFAGTATITATVSGAISSSPALLSITCGQTAGCNPSFPATCVNPACTTGFTTSFNLACGSNCGAVTLPGCIPNACIPPSNFFQQGTTSAPNIQAIQSTACQVSVVPVNAASITVQAPTSAGCNETFLVNATLKDANGIQVPNGTIANFSSTLGRIQATDQTAGGLAVASLMIPERTSGTAQITVTSGGSTGNASVNISCAAASAGPAAATPVPAAPRPAGAPPPPPVFTQPLAPAVSAVRPPSTGDAGLKDTGGGE